MSVLFILFAKKHEVPTVRAFRVRKVQTINLIKMMSAILE